MKKLTLYLWDLILGQKLVISSTVILPFEKIYIYIFENLQGLAEICPHHYLIARSTTKMSFHLSNIYQLVLGDCPRLKKNLSSSCLIKSIIQYENRLYFYS